MEEVNFIPSSRIRLCMLTDKGPMIGTLTGTGSLFVYVYLCHQLARQKQNLLMNAESLTYFLHYLCYCMGIGI